MQHIPWHAPRKYYEMYSRDMPLPAHDHTPVGIPPYALTDTWHAVRGHTLTLSALHLLRASPCICVYFIRSFCICRQEWDKFADLNETVVPVSPMMPRDNSTVPVLTQQMVRQAYRAAISFTDRNIGVVLNKMKQDGWYKEAIVLLLGDHGYANTV